MAQDHKKQPQRGGVSAGQVQETFWDGVGRAAVERAGRGSQLKGVVHEQAYCATRNLSPGAILRGEHTRLTRSVSATTVDAVTEQGGRIVGRVQLKDVVSPSGVREVAQRAQAGDYRSAQLVGTRETTEAFARTGSRKQMTSSGISSDTTTRVADNAGARVPNRDLHQSNMRDISNASVNAAGMGAAVGAAGEAVRAGGELWRGEIGAIECGARVVGAGVVSGVEAGARNAAALGLKEAAKEGAKRLGSESLRRAAGSNAGTAVAFGAVEQVMDTARVLTGDIDAGEYAQRTAGNVAGTAGAVGGAEAGIMLGTALCPGVGTVVGGVIGGMLGGTLGRWLCS